MQANVELKPYIGPRPFDSTAEDRKRFEGRYFETRRIISYIYSHPVTLVYAPSGSGKTSLLNAAIIPELEDRGFDVLPVARVQHTVANITHPEKVTNQYIFNALLRFVPENDPEDVADETLKSFLEKYPRLTTSNHSPSPRLIVFDQFEEIFTIPAENWKEQQQSFFEQVAEAIEADKLLRVLFIIREEFTGQLEEFGHLLPEEFRIRYRLGPLSKTNAEAALTIPLKNTKRHFAEGVAEKVVADMARVKWTTNDNTTKEIQGESVEPVHLQLVGATLWENLPSEVTTIESKHVEQYGDVDKILEEYYESSVEAIVKSRVVKESQLRNWFDTKLITTANTRNIAFRGTKTTQGIPNSVIDDLSDQHIIRGEERAGGRWYELTHDRWIQPIRTANAAWRRVRAKSRQKRIMAGLLSIMLVGALFTAFEYKNLNLNQSIVPTPDNKSYKIVTSLLEPSYNKFKILRDIRVLDFRSRKKLPFWHGKLDGRYSPVTWVRYTLANKQDEDATELVFRYATSGYLSPRSLTHDYDLEFCPNCPLHPNRKTREAWHIVAKVENEPVGEDFLVVTEATFWNAFQGNENNKEWASISVTDEDTDMIGISLIFPDDTTYKDLNLYKTSKETKNKTLLNLPPDGEVTKGENGTTEYKLFLDQKSRTVFWFINDPDSDYRYDVEWTWVDRDKL